MTGQIRNWLDFSDSVLKLPTVSSRPFKKKGNSKIEKQKHFSFLFHFQNTQNNCRNSHVHIYKYRGLKKKRKEKVKYFNVLKFIELGHYVPILLKKLISSLTLLQNNFFLIKILSHLVSIVRNKTAFFF